MALRTSLAVMLSVAGACAQVLVDSGTAEGRKLAAGFEEQWKQPAARKLKCDLVKFPPSLDYGLRLWTGFNASVPAAEFGAKEPRRMAVALRVTPLEPAGLAVYFYQSLNVPKAPEGVDLKKVRLNVGGGFLVGPGRYRVDWLLITSEARLRRESWKLDVPSRQAALGAGKVEPVETALWRGFPGNLAGKTKRAAIFLHASPVWPRRYVSRLSPWDRQILLTTLSSVLRDGGFTSASVTVFDLQNRRVLAREENIEPRTLRRLARQLAQVDYSTVSMETLAQGASPRPFLEEILREEAKRAEGVDGVLFIGSRWRGGPKVDGVSPGLKESMKKWWFLAFSTPHTLTEADAVSSLVRAARGKVYSIFRPADLAGAVKEIAAAP
jgi:hypothetical protein